MEEDGAGEGGEYWVAAAKFKCKHLTDTWEGRFDL